MGAFTLSLAGMLVSRFPPLLRRSGFGPNVPARCDQKKQASQNHWTRGLFNHSVMITNGLVTLACGIIFCVATSGPEPSVSGLLALVAASMAAALFVWTKHTTGRYEVRRYGKFLWSLADGIRTGGLMASVAFVPARESHAWFDGWATVIFRTPVLALAEAGTEKSRVQFAPSAEFVDAPGVEVMRRPFEGSQALWKVLEDYAVGAVGLVLAAPLLLAATVLIRLDDGGPVIFRQVRVGFNGKPFTMYKFRTMTVDPTDDGTTGVRRDSPRVTRAGRILRRSSIDELPQLINVLLGEMSIVGPRPHVANMRVEGATYTNVVPRYAARQMAKPGITGWAQINGMRGGIDTVAKASRGADLDLYYIANSSLWFDIKIILETLFLGLVGPDVF